MGTPVTPSSHSRGFEEALAFYAAPVLLQLEAYERHQPRSSDGGSLDQAAGWLRRSGVTVHQSPLGSLDVAGTWRWAWADGDAHPAGAARLELACWLRGFGERHELDEFTEPQVPLSGFHRPRLAAERIALLSLGALRTRGFAAVPAPPVGDGQEATGWDFVVVDDADVPEAAFDRGLLSEALQPVLRFFPEHPRLTLVGYLRYYGFAVTEGPDGGTVRGERENYTVTARFTEDDQIAAISHGRPAAG